MLNYLKKLQLAHISGNDRYAGTKKNSTDPFSGFNLGVFCLNPKSRGTVHTVSPNPNKDPEIKTNYFSEAEDLEATISGIDLLRKIAEKPLLKNLIVKEIMPSSKVSSHAEMIEYIKETGQTCWHSVGTCKMGKDRMAVVDEKLRVHGIDGLRIADASVMPHLVSSNTNAPTIMIGERCADFILNE